MPLTGAYDNPYCIFSMSNPTTPHTACQTKIIRLAGTLARGGDPYDVIEILLDLNNRIAQLEMKPTNEVGA